MPDEVTQDALDDVLDQLQESELVIQDDDILAEASGDSIDDEDGDDAAIVEDEDVEAVLTAGLGQEELTDVPLAPADTSDLPGADTAGLDAAPQEIPTRVGAGSAGDLTGLDDEEARASDEEGGDGSDLSIEDGEVDPDHPKDLVDLMEESESPSARP